MKITLLHVSAFLVILVLIPNESYKIIFCATLLLLSFALFRKYFVLILIVSTMILVHFYLYNTIPNSTEYKVYEIHQNYAIIGASGRRVLLYGSKHLQIGTIVEIVETPKKLEEVNTFFQHGYQNWYQRKRLRYYFQNPNIIIKRDNKNIQSFLLQRISNFNQPEVEILLKKVLFGINDENLEDILLSNGMGLFAVYYGVKRVLGFLLKKKGIKIYSFAFAILSIICFSHWLIGLRILLNEFILKNIKNSHERIAWYILIVLGINPFFLYHPAFYFPLLFMIQSLFETKRNRLNQVLMLIPIYLSNQYQVNLIEVLLFHLYQNYIGIIVLIGFICVIFQLVFPLKNVFVWKRSTIPAITITGHMNIVLILVWYYMLFKKENAKEKYILLFFLLVYVQHQSLFNPFFEITQLYIGQGDCAIIRFPFSDEIMIVDTGSHYNWDYLEAFLRANSIKSIGVLFITHDDADHNGNVVRLKELYPIKHVISGEEEIRYQGIQFYFLNQDHKYDNDNDNSVITYFTMNGLNYLYLADISFRVEELLLKEYPALDPNIVKISHHGSKTGTSNRLLEKPNLYLALISNGLNNYYGHPNIEVLKKLDRAQLFYLNTQEFGDIQIKGYFNMNLLITSGFRFVII